MVARGIEQRWISIGDLSQLGWSQDAINRLKSAVPELETGIDRLGKARRLTAVNDWARANGERAISNRTLRNPRASKARNLRIGDTRRKGSNRRGKQKNLEGELLQLNAGEFVQLQALWFESKREAQDAGYIGAKDLEDRLWTASLIEKFLGEPEAFGHNPLGTSPVRYWHRSALLSSESSGDFIDAMGTSLKRRKISWEQALSTIAKSNRMLGMNSEANSIAWGMVLAARF